MSIEVQKLFTNLSKNDLKGGSNVDNQSSNLATPTKKGSILLDRANFLAPNLSVSDSRVRYVRKRKLLKNANGYPYREAELVPVDHDMQKTWYILFYIWDIGRQKLIRRRVLKNEFASRTTLHDRLAYAEKCINEINDTLRRGGYQDTEEKETEIETFNFRGYTLLDGLTYVINRKKEFDKREEGTIKEYEATKTTIEDFLETAGIRRTIRLREVKKDFVNRYLNYLRIDREVGNKTYNLRVATMRSSINTLMSLDHDLYKRNPFAGISELKVITHKHAAYTNDQLLLLYDSMKEKKEDHVLFFIQWIYFTLARPKELRNVKIGHIDMAMRRILFVGDHAKTDIEEYVSIPDDFAEIIESSGIMKYPANYYVFSNYDKKAHTPGPRRVGINVFYKRIVKHLKSTGLHNLNPNFSLYSFKHSGAIGLYLATKDPYLVMKQCRHRTLEQTMEYLRELGLFVQSDAMNKLKNPFKSKN